MKLLTSQIFELSLFSLSISFMTHTLFSLMPASVMLKWLLREQNDPTWSSQSPSQHALLSRCLVKVRNTSLSNTVSSSRTHRIHEQVLTHTHTSQRRRDICGKRSGRVRECWLRERNSIAHAKPSLLFKSPTCLTLSLLFRASLSMYFKVSGGAVSTPSANWMIVTVWC